MIKYDSNKAGSNDFELLPEGKYECIIDTATPKVATTGTQGIEIVLTIRNDVEGQKFGGRKLWYRLWINENTEGIVHGFLKSIGTPEGKEFGSPQELATYAAGRAVSATVKHREYQGKTREDVPYLNASVVGGGKIDSPFDEQPMADPFAPGGGPIEVTDDDLPF